MKNDDTDKQEYGQTMNVLLSSRSSLGEWLAWAVLVAIVYSQVSNFDREIQEYAFGATGWPSAICLCILLGATGQLAFRIHANWRNAAAGQLQAPKEPMISGFRFTKAGALTFGFFVLPFIYLYLAQRIGFYVATPFFILGLLALMQVRSASALVLVTVVVYGLALALFTRFFYVALPTGRIEFFYDINNAIIVLARTGV